MHGHFKKQSGEVLGETKQTAAQAILDSGVGLDEGDGTQSFKIIWKLIFEVEGGNYIFARIFLNLEYNLLAQGDNFSAIYVNHVQWNNDSLRFLLI